jgi:hypothetical protein
MTVRCLRLLRRVEMRSTSWTDRGALAHQDKRVSYNPARQLFLGPADRDVIHATRRCAAMTLCGAECCRVLKGSRQICDNPVLMSCRRAETFASECDLGTVFASGNFVTQLFPFFVAPRRIRHTPRSADGETGAGASQLFERNSDDIAGHARAGPEPAFYHDGREVDWCGAAR